jgi:hypothetical protein
MKNKIIPIVLILSSLFMVAKKNDFFIPSDGGSVVVETDKTPSADYITKVKGIADIVKSSKATAEQRAKMAEMWFAASETFEISNIDITSDKIPQYNADLIAMFAKRYPEIVGLFPGVSAEIKNVLEKEIGEYPVKITNDNKERVVKILNAIGWAFL